MKTKFIVTFILFSTLISGAFVMAKPLTPAQNKHLLENNPENQGFLRKQMSQLILSLADLEILTQRDQIADYELFIEDADRILKAIAEIRAIDSTGVFKKLLDDLETPTQKLKTYSLKQNPKAMAVPQKIFEACFKCHATHRDPVSR